MKTLLTILIIISSVILSASIGYAAHIFEPERAPGWSLLGAIVVSAVAIRLIAIVFKKN